MNSAEVLSHWRKAVSSAMSFLTKPQALVLAAFSLGVSLQRSCALHRVAEGLFWLGKPDTVERRLQRWLNNRKFRWKRGCQDLSRWIFTCLGKLPGPYVLLVDEVPLQEHLKVMVVALAYQGRALPLAWWAYPQEAMPLGQVKLINTLLSWVAKALPEGAQVLVQADRGIGTSPALIRALEKRHWYFLFRVQGGVRLHLQDGREVEFARVLQKQGQKWGQPLRAFKGAGWLPCRALAWWGRGFKEPWLLVTNCPQAQADDYGYRMWEELAFRDLKSGGFQWHKSKVRDPEHANRLWLVLALAYAWVVSLGELVLEDAQRWQEITRGLLEHRRHHDSIFSLGLRYLDRWFHLGRELLYGLHLKQVVLLSKSVVP